MKRLTVIIVCLILSSGIFAQGIEFREGSWDEMLTAARTEKKMVFTDFSTVWCGVCKLMVKNIFSQEQVGKFYNENFICYKLDAGIGEGKEIARKYDVGAYPTFLFVDGEGNAILKCTGYMEADAFIEKGQTALKGFTYGQKTIEAWEAEYLSKKNNASFVRRYLAYRENLLLDNADVLDQYCRIAREKDLMAPDFLKKLISWNTQINADGPYYHFVIGHLPAIIRTLGENEWEIMTTFQRAVINYSLDKAIQFKDEKILQAVLNVCPYFAGYLKKDSREYSLELTNRYNYGVGDAAAFEKSSADYVDYIAKDKKELLEADSMRYSAFLNSLISRPEKLDSLIGDYNIMGKPLDEEILRRAFAFIPNESIRDFSYKLSEVVTLAVRISHNRAYLLRVLSWAVDAATLSPDFTNEGILAEAFYALGLKEEGLARMKEARRKAIATMNTTDGFAAQMLEKIEKMENNEPLGK